MSRHPQAAERFYGSVLGWSFRPGPPEAHALSVAELAGRPVAGVGRLLSGGLPSMWTVYLAAASADEAAEAIRSNGGTVAVGPLREGAAGRVVVAADPLGAPFAVWEPDGFGGVEGRDEAGEVAWCELRTPDTEASARFYRAVFGLRAVRGGAAEAAGYVGLAAEGAAGRPVSWVREAAEAADAGPRWLTYFRVRDADGAADLAAAAGGRVLAAPGTTPYGRVAGLADPEGTFFGVVSGAS